LSSDSSCQSMIDEIKRYCKSRVLTLKKDMKEIKNDKLFLSYLIGQEIAHKEILGILNDSSHTKEIPNDTSPNSVPDKPYRMSEILTEEDVEEFTDAFLKNVNKELGIEDDE